MRGVETQKLKESRRGKTVTTGSRSNIVTISFLPRLACLIPEHSLYIGCFCSFILHTVTLYETCLFLWVLVSASWSDAMFLLSVSLKESYVTIRSRPELKPVHLHMC